MGIRLTIYKVHARPDFYGTKLYGYVSDITKLSSYNYLLKNGNYNYACEYGGDPMLPIKMPIEDFKVWIKLYGDDVKKYSPYPDTDIFEDEDIKHILSLDDEHYVLLDWE
jgi:hypothetical protein